MSAIHNSRAVLIGLLAAAATPTLGVTITHDNPHPEIQMWSYPAGSANGAGAVRGRASTFASYSSLDEETNEPVFYEGSGTASSRRGSFLAASDTSADIPTGLAPSRYQIDSLRITTTLLGNLINPSTGRVLPYDDTLDSAEDLTTGVDTDAGRPMELYGIGLQGGYETISFDANSVENALQLGGVRWASDGPYQFFAIDADGRDAENSVNGGYSATEADGHTDRFTPSPFAIGKAYRDGVELSPGELADVQDKFVFEPNLQDAGVLEYVRRSLSEGHLGFSFSSMHQPSGHGGTVAYPDFYLDDLDVGHNPDGAAPRIELQVTLLDPPTPGDYDGSGAVDDLDYALWRSQFGGAGPEADGNQDGLVDAADYTLWRDQMTVYAAAPLDASPVPEPSGLTALPLFGVTASFCGWVEWFVRPSRRLGDQDA